MKRKLTAIVLVLNVLLVALGFYFLQTVSKPPAKPESSPEEVERVRAHVETLRKKGGSKGGQASTVYVTNDFHWSQLESSDYREYIGKLRSIGCPEATIKDIIITDIMRLYAARRGQFYHNGREFKFWETDEKRKLKATQLEEREKQLAVIDKEIPKVLRELLGVNYEREIDKYFVDANEDERRLSFISEDKRARVLSLREETEGMREKILARSNGKFSPADLEALQKIEEHRREILAQVLSPAEIDQLELTTSPTAERLRSELIGFEPSEDEFREIYNAMKEHDQKYAYVDLEHPLIARARQQELQEIEDALREKMGEARYAEYQRSRNAEFHNAALFTQLYELPASTTTALFDIKAFTTATRDQILANSTLSEQERVVALVELQESAEKDLLQILGPKVLSNYTQSSGAWVSNLTKSD